MTRNYLYLLSTLFVLLQSCSDGSKTISETKDSIAKNTPDALQKINRQLAENPDNMDLLHERARYYMETKEYTKSYTDLMRVLSQDSSKAQYYLTLSDLYFYTNKTGNSKKALEKALELDEKNIDALLKLAELYLYVQKNDRSIEYINKALKIDQYNAKAYFMKGMNYKDVRDTAKAISSMQTAVEQDQHYYHAYMQLGILTAAQRNPMAVQFYKNAIRIQPNSTEAWYAIGKFYQDMGDWENAIVTYKALINADAQNKYALYNTGVIYLLQLKQYKLAHEQFTEAIRIDPEYIEAYYSRAVTLQAMGDKANAIADYQSCLRINSKYEPALTGLKELNKLK